MKSLQFNEQEAKEERENYWLNNFKLNACKYRLLQG